MHIYCLFYCYKKKPVLSFCLSGTGTNVCYMEELKNIEKYKGDIEKAAGEERTPEGQEDRVTEAC